MQKPFTATALAVTLAAGAWMADPASAMCFPVPEEGRVLTSLGQLNLILFDRAANQVKMIPNLRFNGNSEDFALVVPTPALPTLQAEAPELWREAETLTLPITTRSDFDLDNPLSCSETDYEPAPNPTESFDVIIHTTTQVGGMIATVLSSDNADALVTWLNTHGYHVSLDLTTRIAPYVERDWYFTAMRPDSSDSGNQMPPEGWDSNVDPVSFTWTGSTFELPLEILDISHGSSLPVVAYVVDDHRVSIGRFDTHYANRINAGELREIRAQYPNLGALLSEGRFLTRLAHSFGRNDAMTGTLPIIRARADDEFRLTRRGGLWFAGDLGLLVLAGLSTLLDGLRRRRRAQGAR
ncbi:MAG: DUF2330 domain-containing protein [Candidatus Eisenbacteria bacterium]|nr:DUF2330 domain-containing protein [Candidatus Eisenbacteria bacterium]MCC7144570.1 DUF2330 domain-containing protein [Candidatus Eisenbacteria bacterium]